MRYRQQRQAGHLLHRARLSDRGTAAIPPADQGQQLREHLSYSCADPSVEGRLGLKAAGLIAVTV
jgi:hypothetical protein